MGLLSGIIGGALGLLGNKMDQDFQKKAAQNSIQWRVKDANKAGVSPLFALGAPTMNFQSSIGPTLGAAGSEVGSGFESMGQDISRARAATMDAPERDASGMMLKLQLERGGLENELLRRQISQIGSPGVPGRQTAPLIPGQTPRDPDAVPMGIVFPNGEVLETGATSPSNTIEQQYGDVAQNAHGVWRLATDAYAKFDRDYPWIWEDRVPGVDRKSDREYFVPKSITGRR